MPEAASRAANGPPAVIAMTAAVNVLRPNPASRAPAKRSARANTATPAAHCTRRNGRRTRKGENPVENRLSSMLTGSSIVGAHLEQPRNVVRSFGHQPSARESFCQTSRDGHNLGVATVEVRALVGKDRLQLWFG